MPMPKPTAPVKPVLKRQRKANVKQLQTQQIPPALPEIPCAVHLEFKLTWFGLTLTKVTKPLV
tara:strand:- start:298 stop:486 length:189 start_codon:yes stop_codon:yes gene_type:complete